MSKKKLDFRDALRESFPVVLPDEEKRPPKRRSRQVTDENDREKSEQVSLPPAGIPSPAPPDNGIPAAGIPSVGGPSPGRPAANKPTRGSRSFSIHAAVFDVLPKLQTPSERLVYLCLYRESHGRKQPTCIMGLKALSERSSLSRNTVIAALTALEKKGHIDRLKSHGQQGTEYRVLLPHEILS
jgi:hypothetical protein